MQSDRYNPGSSSSCVWCGANYMEGYSRAQAQDLFCTRRCEIEARFWLLDQINAVIIYKQQEDRHPLE